MFSRCHIAIKTRTEGMGTAGITYPPPPFFLGVSLLNGYKSCFARTQSERVSELGLRVRKDAFCFYHATIELVFRLVTASLNG
jgi:hypothetical protein